MKSVRNFTVSIKKDGDNIIFLRKIIEGSSDNSYGIEVAKLAGVPDEIIFRAKEILSDLEKEEIKLNDSKILYNHVDSSTQNIINKLKKIDTNKLTPIDSMNILFDLTKMA